MCRAFSAIVEPSCKVTWKLGVDSHTDLLRIAGLRDDTDDPRQMMFARVEVTPKNNSYIKPDEWVFRVDQSITPAWFTEKHKEAAIAAKDKWLNQLNKILVRKDIVHPFRINAPAKITARHIDLLKQWDSVWGSVGDSVWAYIGSFFTLPKWEYVTHTKGKYPFDPSVKLWNAGLVPSFDGTTWRLHAGPKAQVVFSITEEELRRK
jgi:hypothetical protein